MRLVGRALPLSAAALERGLTLATESPDARAWRVFLSRALLLLGAGSVLAGVICFVAYNWANVGRFGKFGVAAAAIAAAAIYAWRAIPKLTGEIALFTAAVLVGALLAIFGQTYQTGADPYGLFATWALLILPWVIASRFSATWVLLLLLIDTAITLYWGQVIGARETRDMLWLPLVVGAIHFGALAAWQWQRKLALPWLTERWAQRFVAVCALYAWWLAATVTLFVSSRAGVAGVIGLALFVIAVAAMVRFYRRPRDLFMMTIAVAAAMAFGTALVGRILFEVMRVGFFGMMLMAALVVWEITVGLKWYRSMRDAS